MLDVIANHVAPVGVEYSKIVPFDLPEYYHEKCDIKSTSWCGADQYNLEHCRLFNLPDLNQDGNYFVRQTLKNWVHDIIKNYSFDGIRIDTVPHVSREFWKEY